MKFWEIKVDQIPGPLSHPSPQLICGMTIFLENCYSRFISRCISSAAGGEKEGGAGPGKKTVTSSGKLLSGTYRCSYVHQWPGWSWSLYWSLVTPTPALLPFFTVSPSVSCLTTVKLESLKAGAKHPWYGHRESLTTFTIPSTHLHFPQESFCTVSPES